MRSLALAAAVALCACSAHSSSSSEAKASDAKPAAANELVGKWTTGTTAPDGLHGTSATWDFRGDGTFSMSGYPPIDVTGRWKISERQPGKVHLVITNQKMKAPGMEPSDWPDRDAWGDLSADGNTLTYDGETFRRAN